VKLPDLVPVRQSTTEAVTKSFRELTTPTIRLGVTGLSRAGKTVFITSLVRNLMGARRMPFFTAAHTGVLSGAILKPQPDDEIPSFDYREHLEALTRDPPTWPENTQHISQLRLALQVAPQTTWGSLTGMSQVYLDIVDYPGEWLLDLELMELDYATWSARILDQVGRADHAEISAEFRAALADIDDKTTFEDDTARTVSRAFTKYLRAAREKPPGLATLGPGRFLLPGERSGSPLLTFAPLSPEAHDIRTPYATEFARRFEGYKSQIVRPFFNKHFRKLDRQIVLVDALAALNGGAQSLEDLRAALRASLAAFRPGNASWLRRLIGDVRIDKVLFAATKADHLPQSSHDRLQRVLKLLTDDASRSMEQGGASVDVLALAAVRATREATGTDGGETFSVIKGRPLAGESIAGETYDGNREAAIFPGDLPDDPVKALADAESGALSDMTFVRFAPPELEDETASTIWPHIRLDRALEYLISDRLP